MYFNSTLCLIQTELSDISHINSDLFIFIAIVKKVYATECIPLTFSH